jgi:hypothetical protein
MESIRQDKYRGKEKSRDKTKEGRVSFEGKGLPSLDL